MVVMEEVVVSSARTSGGSQCQDGVHDLFISPTGFSFILRKT